MQETQNVNTQAPAQECPECAATVELTPTMLGELVDCQDCSAELETISLEPPRYAVAPELEEDWGE